MGFRVDIDGQKTEILNYSVDESATPLAAGDSSGAVGSFSITFSVPDPHVLLGTVVLGFGYGDGPYGDGPYGGTTFVGTPNTPWKVVRELGPQILLGSPIRISDPRKGFTLGTIREARTSKDAGTITLSGPTRLSVLNVYGVQAQPFVGTLGNAFEYYLGLANITTDLFVDDDITDRPVIFPGWSGELWYHLKMMAAAQDCDISLVSGVTLLRDVRKRVATQNRDVSRTLSTGGATLAQSVEVYQYSNREITNELVYPPGGWTPEVQVMNVNAGETAEYTLEMSASLSSFQEPTMQTFVGQNHASSSVYTIVADDGLPVSVSQWAASGGSLTVQLLEDTKRLLVKLQGATGIPTAQGATAQNFSVALGSDTTGNRYSTFRIIGTGVGYDKQKKRIRTGVPPEKTATEVGVTIDNPFISTTNDLYSTGVRAARQYSGAVMSLSGEVTAVNRRGDTGQATYPSYAQVQDQLDTDLTAPTYAEVATHYSSLSLTSYVDVREYWFDFFRDDDLDQVFGNVQGARVYDRSTRRWYRVREGSLGPSTISFSSADDDLIHSDIQEFYDGKTYGDVQTVNGIMDYSQVDLAGMWR